MSWRYQPVILDGDGPSVFALVEAYFNDDDTLKNWAEPVADPAGDDIGELRRDIARMLADAYKWVPVRYADLKPGMTFDRTGVDVEAMITAMTKAAP